MAPSKKTFKATDDITSHYNDPDYHLVDISPTQKLVRIPSARALEKWKTACVFGTAPEVDLLAILNWETDEYFYTPPDSFLLKNGADDTGIMTCFECTLMNSQGNTVKGKPAIVAKGYSWKSRAQTHCCSEGTKTGGCPGIVTANQFFQSNVSASFVNQRHNSQPFDILTNN